LAGFVLKFFEQVSGGGARSHFLGLLLA